MEFCGEIWLSFYNYTINTGFHFQATKRFLNILKCKNLHVNIIILAYQYNIKITNQIEQKHKSVLNADITFVQLSLNTKNVVQFCSISRIIF